MIEMNNDEPLTKDDPLTDRDYHFIQQYGLHCWKEAIRLDGVTPTLNGNRLSVAKYEANSADYDISGTTETNRPEATGTG